MRKPMDALLAANADGRISPSRRKSPHRSGAQAMSFHLFQPRFSSLQPPEKKWDTVALLFASKSLKTQRSAPKEVGHFRRSDKDRRPARPERSRRERATRAEGLSSRADIFRGARPCFLASLPLHRAASRLASRASEFHESRLTTHQSRLAKCHTLPSKIPPISLKTNDRRSCKVTQKFEVQEDVLSFLDHTYSITSEFLYDSVVGHALTGQRVTSHRFGSDPNLLAFSPARQTVYTPLRSCPRRNYRPQHRASIPADLLAHLREERKPPWPCK